jgi:hypothetical protein
LSPKSRQRLVMIGDNIKIVKEALMMPTVRKLHQDSEYLGKSEFIYGHNHGVVGIVAQSDSQLTCIPLMSGIQDGIKQINQMRAKDNSKAYDTFTRRPGSYPSAITIPNGGQIMERDQLQDIHSDTTNECKDFNRFNRSPISC